MILRSLLSEEEQMYCCVVNGTVCVVERKYCYIFSYCLKEMLFAVHVNILTEFVRHFN
jgi:hypothetical protein